MKLVVRILRAMAHTRNPYVRAVIRIVYARPLGRIPGSRLSSFGVVLFYAFVCLLDSCMGLLHMYCVSCFLTS